MKRTLPTGAHRTAPSSETDLHDHGVCLEWLKYTVPALQFEGSGASTCAKGNWLSNASGEALPCKFSPLETADMWRQRI
jgi:hypothetical protein